MKNILLIIDPQNDFITGTLAVEGAEEKMMKLSEYLIDQCGKYDFLCVTSDTHSKKHISFKENGGIWPTHCIFETDGWFVPEYLSDAIEYNIQKGIKHQGYWKGTENDKEEYSIFDNCEDGNTLSKQISELIQDEGEVYIDICGIAGDYCVLESLKGLRRIIGDKYITVLTQFTPSIDGGEKLMNYIKENNISYE